MKGARLVLLTLTLSVLIGFATPFNKSLFAGFSLVLLGMFYLLSLRIKEQRLAYENTLVQSTRLRLELLKKNIQPHFIMNTLTSIMEWVETSPKKFPILPSTKKKVEKAIIVVRIAETIGGITSIVPSIAA